MIETYLQKKLNEVKKSDFPPFLDHLLQKIRMHINNQGKILLVTLTKKSSEEVTNFLIAQGFKAFYLHSEIATIDRWEIIKKLRTGEIDIIVGVCFMQIVLLNLWSKHFEKPIVVVESKNFTIQKTESLQSPHSRM